MQHGQGIAQSSQSERAAGGESRAGRSHPVQPTPKVKASLWQSAGIRAADGGEMTAYRYSSHGEEGCSLSKDACGDSVISCSQIFIFGKVFRGQKSLSQCRGTVSRLRWGHNSGDVLQKLHP